MSFIYWHNLLVLARAILDYKNCAARYLRLSPDSYEEGWSQLDGLLCRPILKPLTQTVLTTVYALVFLHEFIAWTTVHYLSGRHQFVEIDDKTSSIETVLFGVPHGSILGPFMFNLYVSDLQKHTWSVLATSTRTIQLPLFTQRPRIQYLVCGITHLNHTSLWMKLKQSGCLFPLIRCLELTRYRIMMQLWAAMGS